MTDPDEIDPYDQAVEREQIHEMNARHTLDLQKGSWRNLWWSLGILILLFVCFGCPKWFRTIWQ